MDRRTLIAASGAVLALACSRRRETPPAPREIAVDFSPIEARHGGRLGLAAADGAASVLWRGDERFATASTFKLFLAAAVLERAHRGAEDLERLVPVAEGDMLPHAPVTENAVGGALTIETLCRAIVEVSDNPAANLLFEAIGGPAALTAYYRSLGDETSRSDRIEIDLNTAIAGDPRDTATPRATLANLRALFLTERLAAPDRDRLETWLENSTPGPGRIKAGVPAGWRVGHKTGTGGNGSTNDIGIIRPPSGPPILIAVYFAESDAPLAAREAAIAEATRLAVATLGRS